MSLWQAKRPGTTEIRSAGKAEFAQTSRECDASTTCAAGYKAGRSDGRAEQKTMTNLTVNLYPRNRRNATMKKQHTTPVPEKQPTASAEELQEKIRQRAYEIYELRGREDGRDLDDWLKAESEMTGIAVQQ